MLLVRFAKRTMNNKKGGNGKKTDDKGKQQHEHA